MAVSKNQKLYSYLDRLSTQELEALLQKEAETLDGDPDMAMYIMEVMEKREGGLEGIDKEDNARAWEEFLSDYATPEGDGLCLYPSDAIDGKSTISASEKAAHTKKRCLHHVRRVAVVAAMLGCAFLLTACSLGGVDRFFRMVGSWTAEVFTFENKYRGNISEKMDISALAPPEGTQFAGIEDALTAYGVTEQVFPTIPTDYELSTIEIYPFGENKVLFYTIYESNDHYMMCQATLYGEPGAMSFEKDDTEVVEHEHNGIQYYFYSNNNSRCVSWYAGTVECLIDSDLSTEELMELIDSI